MDPDDVDRLLPEGKQIIWRAERIVDNGRFIPEKGWVITRILGETGPTRRSPFYSYVFKRTLASDNYILPSQSSNDQNSGEGNNNESPSVNPNENNLNENPGENQEQNQQNQNVITIEDASDTGYDNPIPYGWSDSVPPSFLANGYTFDSQDYRDHVVASDLWMASCKFTGNGDEHTQWSIIKCNDSSTLDVEFSVCPTRPTSSPGNVVIRDIEDPMQEAALRQERYKKGWYDAEDIITPSMQFYWLGQRTIQQVSNNVWIYEGLWRITQIGQEGGDSLYDDLLNFANREKMKAELFPQNGFILDQKGVIEYITDDNNPQNSYFTNQLLQPKSVIIRMAKEGKYLIDNSFNVQGSKSGQISGVKFSYKPIKEEVGGDIQYDEEEEEGTENTEKEILVNLTFNKTIDPETNQIRFESNYIDIEESSEEYDGEIEPVPVYDSEGKIVEGQTQNKERGLIKVTIKNLPVFTETINDKTNYEYNFEEGTVKIPVELSDSEWVGIPYWIEIPVRLNRLGTRISQLIGDMETIYMEKTSYSTNGSGTDKSRFEGMIQTSSQGVLENFHLIEFDENSGQHVSNVPTKQEFGEYQRTATENLSNLSRKVFNGTNLLCTNWTNIQGTSSVDYTSSDHGYAYSPFVYLSKGTYIFSAYFNYNNRPTFWYGTTSNTTGPFSYNTTLNVSTAAPEADTYNSFRRYYCTITVNTSQYYKFKASNNIIFYRPQLELAVNNPTTNTWYPPTEWDAGPSEISSKIIQTAESIEVDINDAKGNYSSISENLNHIASEVAGETFNSQISQVANGIAATVSSGGRNLLIGSGRYDALNKFVLDSRNGGQGSIKSYSFNENNNYIKTIVDLLEDTKYTFQCRTNASISTSSDSISSSTILLQLVEIGGNTITSFTIQERNTADNGAYYWIFEPSKTAQYYLKISSNNLNSADLYEIMLSKGEFAGEWVAPSEDYAQLKITTEGISSIVSDEIYLMGKNLLDCASGYGWRKYSDAEPVPCNEGLQQIGPLPGNPTPDMDVVSTAVYLTAGKTYIMSFYAPNASQTPWVQFCRYNSSDPTDIGMQQEYDSNATSGTGESGRYYHACTISDSGYYKVNIWNLKYFQKPQLELAIGNNTQPTEWEGYKSSAMSQIKQTANEIQIFVYDDIKRKTGIDITNGTIDLIANKVHFKYYDSNNVLQNAQVSISASDGTLSATNVDLSGKITATDGKIGGFLIDDDEIKSSNAKIILNKNGTATFKDGSFKGEILATSGKITGNVIVGETNRFHIAILPNQKPTLTSTSSSIVLRDSSLNELINIGVNYDSENQVFYPRIEMVNNDSSLRILRDEIYMNGDDSSLRIEPYGIYMIGDYSYGWHRVYSQIANCLADTVYVAPDDQGNSAVLTVGAHGGKAYLRATAYGDESVSAWPICTASIDGANWMSKGQVHVMTFANLKTILDNGGGVFNSHLSNYAVLLTRINGN